MANWSEDLSIAPALRMATAADAETIAALHAASWRATYRGILKDDYLNGDIAEERRRVWTERLSAHVREAPIVIVAYQSATLVGFSCLMPRFHPSFGALLDNLHVAQTRQSHGLGKKLFAAAIEQLPRKGSDTPVHLIVFAQNRKACAIYERLGGRVAECRKEREPDGSHVDVVRYQWERGDLLLARLQAAAPF